MGTGVGGSLVVNQQGHRWQAWHRGEWGYNFLDESGGSCYCGKTGCVETVVAGPSLERFYAKISGGEKKLKDIVTEYRQGNALCTTNHGAACLNNLAGPLQWSSTSLTPMWLSWGGGVGSIDEIYTEGVERVKNTFSTKGRSGLSQNQFGR